MFMCFYFVKANQILNKCKKDNELRGLNFWLGLPSAMLANVKVVAPSELVYSSNYMTGKIFQFPDYQGQG